MGKGEECATHARGEALLHLCVNCASRSPCVCLFCRLKEREWDSVRTACLLIFVHLNVWFWEFASSEAHDGLNSIENFWRYISVLIWPRNGKFVSDFLIFTLKGWLVIRYVNNSSSRRRGEGVGRRIKQDVLPHPFPHDLSLQGGPITVLCNNHIAWCHRVTDIFVYARQPAIDSA